MLDLPHTREDLQQICRARFQDSAEYRRKMWAVLARFFERWIPSGSTVLDLGCGHCEFINAVRRGRKFGMDLNPDSAILATNGTVILEQACSQPWQVDAGSIDVVFQQQHVRAFARQGIAGEDPGAGVQKPETWRKADRLWDQTFAASTARIGTSSTITCRLPSVR